MRTIFLLLLAAACSDPVAGGTTDGGTSAGSPAGVRAAAERLVRALSQGDSDVQVELAHPKLVEKIGGEAKYRATLARAFAEAQASGTSLRATIVGTPTVVSRGGRLYALVDYDLEIAGSSGQAGVMASFFAAESAANEVCWRFLDGAGLKGDVARLRRLLPDWPDELKLRAVTPR